MQIISLQLRLKTNSLTVQDMWFCCCGQVFGGEGISSSPGYHILYTGLHLPGVRDWNYGKDMMGLCIGLVVSQNLILCHLVWPQAHSSEQLTEKTFPLSYGKKDINGRGIRNVRKSGSTMYPPRDIYNEPKPCSRNVPWNTWVLGCRNKQRLIGQNS